MKSPGIIYRRYRQVKKKLLYEKLVAAKKICHINCIYHKTIFYTELDGSKKIVKICIYNPEFPDICTSALECNAFVSLWSREAVVEEFEKEISNTNLKQKLYPELIILEWILDKDLDDAKKNPNIVGKLIVKIINLLEGLLKIFSKPVKNLE